MKRIVFGIVLLIQYIAYPSLADQVLYVRHITDTFPFPEMKVGGRAVGGRPSPIPYRATLHWSLLGLEPRGERMGLSSILSDTPKKVYHHGKYIVVEPLFAEALSSNPFDIFIVGPHTLSKNSLFFLPESELTQKIKEEFPGTVVTYNVEKESSRESVEKFVKEHPEYVQVKEIFGGIKYSEVEFMNNNDPLKKTILDNKTEFEKADQETQSRDPKNMVFWKAGFSGSTTTSKRDGERELKFDLNAINLNIDGELFILFSISTGNQDDEHELKQYYRSYYKNHVYDSILQMENGKFISLHSYMRKLGINVENLYFDHNTSDFFDYETFSWEALLKLGNEPIDLAALLEKLNSTGKKILDRIPSKHLQERFELFFNHSITGWEGNHSSDD